MLNQIRRDIRDDDRALRSNTVERTEGDEAIATPDVQEALTRFDPSVIKDAIADRQEVLERLLALLWIIAIASVQEPGGPLVQLALHRHRVSGQAGIGARSPAFRPATEWLCRTPRR